MGSLLSSGEGLKADEEEAFLCKLVNMRLEYRNLFYNVTLTGVYLQSLASLLQSFESLLSSPVSANVSLLPLSPMTISRLVVLTHFHVLKAILSFSPGSSDLATKLTNLVKAHRDDLEIQLLFLQFVEGLSPKYKDLRDLFSNKGAFDFSSSSSSSLSLPGSDEQGQVLKHLLSKYKQVLPDPLSLQSLPSLPEKDLWNEILSSSSSSSSSSISFGSLDLMSPGAGGNSIEQAPKTRKSKEVEELIKHARNSQQKAELHASPPSPIPHSSLEASHIGPPPTFDFSDEPEPEEKEQERKQEEAGRGHRGYSLKRKSNASPIYEVEPESRAEADRIISQQFLSIKSISTLINDLHNILSSLD